MIFCGYVAELRRISAAREKALKDSERKNWHNKAQEELDRRLGG